MESRFQPNQLPQMRESGFTPKGSSPRADLPFIVRPRGAPGFAVFKSDDGVFEAYVLGSVLDKIDAELARAKPLETIGLLAGRVMRDSEGPYTLVLACEDARGNETEATPGHVRITAEGHAKLRRRLELTAFGLDLIGWYHSHPTFPARFSSVDTIEQSTLKDPNHLGIVVSGIDNLRPYGVYKGPAALLLAPQSPIRRPLKESSNVAPANAPADTNALSLQLEGTQANRPLQTVASAAAAQANVSRISPRRRRPVLPWQAFAVAGVVIVGFAVWITARVNSVENRLATLVNRRGEPGNLQTGQATPAPETGGTQTATPPQGHDEKTGTVDLPANPKIPVAKPAKSPDQNTGRNRARRTNRTSSAANRRASSSTRQPSQPPRSTSRSPR